MKKKNTIFLNNLTIRNVSLKTMFFRIDKSYQLTIEPQFNRSPHKYIFYILLKLKKNNE